LDFNNKKLLVISHSYTNFQKDPLECLANFLDSVYVLVRYNPIANISKYLPVHYLDPFRWDSKVDLATKPSNIEVFPTPILYTPTERGYKGLGDKHFKAVEKVIKRNNVKFDLIHAHFTWSSGYVGVKLKEKYKKPVVITIHENCEWFNKEVSMNYPLINYTWKNANALIRVNKKDVPILKNFNKNVYSIPNGFPPSFKPLNKNECRSKLLWPADKKIIFSLGGLVERKGFNYLIDAMKIIAERKKNVLCLIGGPGPLKNRLEKQIEKLELKDYIKLVGGKTHDEIPIWMNACDLFVLPSLSEGNPTVMFECLGCGKPFVGTKVGGIPEIIISDDYGLLCEPGDPKDLAEKILFALKKQWNSKKIRDYAEQFTWEKIAKETIEIYRDVMR